MAAGQLMHASASRPGVTPTSTSVIEQRDVDTATTVLKHLGYVPVPRPDTRPWNFVLGDHVGRQIDFHVIVLNEGGRGLYGSPGTDDGYPAEALTGKGTVNGRTVDC